MSKIFALRKIVAVEAKIANWKRAIEQAINNTWFASHSYVLMPSLKNIEDVVSVSSQFGIGVIIQESDSNSIVSQAKPLEIPSSIGSWLFNEWVIRENSYQ